MPVAYGKLPPFIVTLGILGITRGIAMPLVSVYSIAGLQAAVGGVLSHRC